MTGQPFTYDLSGERIAQRPIYPPEAAKMLVYNRADGSIKHLYFSDFPSIVRDTDSLVFNDTRVIPARLYGHLDAANGPAVEVLLLECREGQEWTAIGYPMKKIRRSGRIVFSNELSASIRCYPTSHEVSLEFSSSSNTDIRVLVEKYGNMPIPPYIRAGRSDDQDRHDYQSVFAKHDGSVAAPTASLHFSQSLIDRIRTESRCDLEQVTLHVGAASFQPVLVEGKLREPGCEVARLSPEVGSRLYQRRSRGYRTIAVGTTVVRALESVENLEDGFCDTTSLFIQPGYRFKNIDCLVTNFHQSGTTHLLLLEALVGREALEMIYESAIDNQYRFLSYGDGMVVL
jgi:S-adenosylmethionine:tRNA ribosyltransferase-isomerase